MLFHKKRHSIFGVNMNRDREFNAMSVVKMAAAGALLYKTAKFMYHEMKD